MDIIKARIQRQIHSPDVLIRFQKGIADASDIDLHIDGVGKAEPQIRHALRPVHQALLAGSGNRRIPHLHHDRAAVGAGLLHDRRVIQPFLIRVHLLPYLQRQSFRHSLRCAKRPDHAIQITAQLRMISGHPFYNDVQPSDSQCQKIINIIQALSLRPGKLQLFLQVFMQLLSGMYSGKIQLDHGVISFFFLHRLSPFSACF